MSQPLRLSGFTVYHDGEETMNVQKQLSRTIQIMNPLNLKSIGKLSGKTGLPPGTLVHVGEKKTEKTRIRLMDYDANDLKEIDIGSVDECLSCKDSSTVSWIEVTGLHDVTVIDQLGRIFDIHPLVLEDILNTSQRPKFEEYEGHLFMTLKNLQHNEEEEIVEAEQVSIVVGQGYVISFLERESDLFEPVRNRVRNSKLRIRKRDSDYLAYALVDNVVDNYFKIVETLGERLEEMDTVDFRDMDEQKLGVLFNLKKGFLSIRKSVLPLQETVDKVINEEYEIISESTRLYFRDVLDHIQQIVDSLDAYREASKDAVDTHLSILSMKMNEVMKVLTIAATIFMPLTFIAGIYGMNFKFMPELEWRWGYFAVLGVMVVLLVVMLIYFRRRSWI